jgi:hypothetical protein
MQVNREINKDSLIIVGTDKNKQIEKKVGRYGLELL